MSRDSHAPWQLEPASAGARAWLVGLTAVLPVAIDPDDPRKVALRLYRDR